MRRRWQGLVLALTLCGCPRIVERAAAPPPEPQPVTWCDPVESARASPDFRDALRGDYLKSLQRARAWLDALEVDPTVLRRYSIKGKKKFTEQLDAYYRLWLVADADARPALLERVRAIAALTRDERYHDMLRVSDLQFKQDATSYLRAALLMDKLGLDTSSYRAEIRRIESRLNAHLAQRGAHQQQTFHWYYQHFGLKEPFPLGKALQKGVIAQRKPVATLSGEDAYALTHEVYAVYEYGDRLDVDPFDTASKEYLAQALTSLIERFQARGDPDLVAELVECQHYLRFSGAAGHEAAVRYLLRAQNESGSWGWYPRQRAQLGDLVEPAFELHTTLVVIGALTSVFDRPMQQPDPRLADGGGTELTGG